jgi:hypothetical protein
MKTLPFLLLAVFVTASCNSPDLIVDPTPTPVASAAPTGWFTPTPDTTPCVVPVVSPHGCVNESFGYHDVNDPDDAPGYADADVCVWMCACWVGNSIWPSDPNGPHEVWAEWDFDGGTPELYWVDFTNACNTPIPQ